MFALQKVIVSIHEQMQSHSTHSLTNSHKYRIPRKLSSSVSLVLNNHTLSLFAICFIIHKYFHLMNAIAHMQQRLNLNQVYLYAEHAHKEYHRVIVSLSWMQ